MKSTTAKEKREQKLKNKNKSNEVDNTITVVTTNKRPTIIK